MEALDALTLRKRRARLLNPITAPRAVLVETMFVPPQASLVTPATPVKSPFVVPFAPKTPIAAKTDKPVEERKEGRTRRRVKVMPEEGSSSAGETKQSLLEAGIKAGLRGLGLLRSPSSEKQKFTLPEIYKAVEPKTRQAEKKSMPPGKQ